MHRVMEVRCVDDHTLALVFDDGASGVVDVRQLTRFEGLFGPLRNATVFEAARLDEHRGTVHWPHGADLDPEVLHCLVTGSPLPAVEDSESDVL